MIGLGQALWVEQGGFLIRAILMKSNARRERLSVMRMGMLVGGVPLLP